MATKQPIFDNIKVDQMTGILSHSTDTYDGVIIHANGLPSSVEEFSGILNASLTYWRSVKKRGVWLKVSRRVGYAFEGTAC
jgi:hypothetical protein